MLENEKKRREVRDLEKKIEERNKTLSLLLDENSTDARRISELKRLGA